MPCKLPRPKHEPLAAHRDGENATDTITDNTGAYINACRFQATANPPTVKLQSNYLTLPYQKIKAATDITCVAEVSSNLISPWLSGSNDVEQLWQVGDGLTTQTITACDKTTVPNASSRFMRLKVTQP